MLLWLSWETLDSHASQKPKETGRQMAATDSMREGPF